MARIKKQEKTADERNAFLLKLMKALGILSFIIAAILLTLILIMRVDSVREKYDQYIMYIREFEVTVVDKCFRNNWLSLIVIFLLYLLRSLSAIYPFPALYIITAMVYPPAQSFAINILYMAFVIAFRYFTGVQMGEGFWNDMLKKNQYISSMFEVDARGNPVVLFALRFVPIFPFNTVSHLYGSFEYPFVKYVLISVVALIPRLISYSFIGKNIYDPLTSKFFVPLAVLFIITGISFLVMRAVLSVSFRHAKHNAAVAAAADAAADPAAVRPADETVIPKETSANRKDAAGSDALSEEAPNTDQSERTEKNE